MRYKKILLLHDGSDRSDKALKHAIYLAKGLVSELRLLNVISIPAKPYGIAPTKAARRGINKHLMKIRSALEKDVRKMLIKRCEQCRDYGVSASYSIEYGVPIEKIPVYAMREKIDIIVMGSKPLPGISRMNMLGSVSRYVAEHVSCPVLIVH